MLNGLDLSVLQSNHFRVVTTAKPELLYHMLESKRIDYFSLRPQLDLGQYYRTFGGGSRHGRRASIAFVLSLSSVFRGLPKRIRRLLRESASA